MIKAGIIGAAGYVAGELIRLLVNHERVNLEFLYSRSQSGKNVGDVHQDLFGETDLKFVGNCNYEVDVLFLCMGHGESRPFMDEWDFKPNTVIIDLSSDFRLNRIDHDFVYGLPEINFKEIREANRISNPGCFATAIQLALLPLISSNIVFSPISISGITGSTGAGVSLSASSHFSWRNNNISVYKAFNHQHLYEVKETLGGVCDETPDIMFIPHRGDFTRGIFCSHFFNSNVDIDEVKKLYSNFYSNTPFTLLSNSNPHLKQVVNTNKCLIYLESFKDKILIVSVIDNLLKGAAGQAVQNMNIRFGFEEKTGLKLKASSF